MVDIKESYVTIYEILDHLNSFKLKSYVAITSDSCYSGLLCYGAKKWWEQNKPNISFKDLIVVASTNRYMKAQWGEYRKYKEKQ